MKRFLVFAWNHYEAQGGLHDLIGSYSSWAEAKQKSQDLKDVFDFVELFDATLTITQQ